MLPEDLKIFLEKDFSGFTRENFLRDLKKCALFSLLELEQPKDTLLENVINVISDEELSNFADKNIELGILIYRQLAILYGCIAQTEELRLAKENFKRDLEKNLFKHHWTSGGARVVSTPVPAFFLGTMTYGVGAAYLLTELVYVPLSIYSYNFPSVARKERIKTITDALYQCIEAAIITNSTDIYKIVEKYHPKTGWSDGNWGFEESFTAEAFEKALFEAIDSIKNPALRTQYLQKANDTETPLGKFTQGQYSARASGSIVGQAKYIFLYDKLKKKIAEAENQSISLFLNKTKDFLSCNILDKLEESLNVAFIKDIRTSGDLELIQPTGSRVGGL